MSHIGEFIGRFEIKEAIGSGAMANVYRAYDPDIDRSVALKILKEEHCLDKELTSRFLIEGRAAGSLSHPNIVTIHDVGKLGDAPYIMMELLQGEDLGCILKRGDNISITKVIKIAMQLAKALNYAHNQGIVHRDIKPDNIIIDIDGETAKIADFGIARIEDSAIKNDRTQAGMLLGTPRYMSPEQAFNKPVDGRSDLFSLGVILYEVLTHKKAFDAESMPTLITQIIQKQPVPIGQLSDKVPRGLQSIVNKLLRKSPAKRFQTGQHLYAALERELRNLQEEDERGGYIPLEIKWTAIMGVVVALVLSVSSYMVYQAQSHALEKQAIDSSLSLAKFVAIQSAIPVLGEDWITLDALVDDASERKAFSYLIISSHDGNVRSATDKTLVGSPWQLAEDAELLYDNEGSSVSRLLNEGTVEIFNYRLPVTFNGTKIGDINIGVDQGRHIEALDTTKRMMGILAFSTVLSVLLVFYIFNKNIARNLRLLTRTVGDFSKGNWDVRVSKKSTDEFGDLFNAFNSLADTVQETIEKDTSVEQSGEMMEQFSGDPDVSHVPDMVVDEQTMVRFSDST